MVFYQALSKLFHLSILPVNKTRIASVFVPNYTIPIILYNIISSTFFLFIICREDREVYCRAEYVYSKVLKLAYSPLIEIALDSIPSIPLNDLPTNSPFSDLKNLESDWVNQF